MEKETMEQLRTRLNSSSQFLQSNDMQVIEVREGYAKVEMTIDEQILNVHGFVHGGALFSLADTAAGAASFATGRDSVTLARYVHFDVRASRRSRKQIQPISSEKIEICLVRFKSISSREHIHYFRKPA